MKVYGSVTELIGRTPILELKNIKKKYNLKANVFAKLEFYNPAGSVKDRVAKQMILDAKENGSLKDDSVIIEPTSGNTGIGLASVAAALGYKAIIVMPDSMSIERRQLMSAYGAKVVLTEGARGMQGAIEKAEEIARETPNSIIAGQFYNPSNPKAHVLTTGPEILEDMDGNVDVFVAGVGTGGTISGCGEYLKKHNSNIKVVAVEPAASPMLTKGVAGPHKIQGIGANFVPEVLNRDVIDEILTVENDEALQFAREIGVTEGVLSGISGGAALAASVRLAEQEAYKDKNIVIIIPDNGDHYLSAGLYE